LQKEELIKLINLWSNNDKRRAFLKSYEEWGVWLTVPELGLTYYQYALPNNGGRILAMSYQSPNPYRQHDGKELHTSVLYYFWDGEHFIPSPAGEWEITNRLKVQKALLEAELVKNRI